MSFIRMPDLSGTTDQKNKERERYIIDLECARENFLNASREAVADAYSRDIASPVSNAITINPDKKFNTRSKDLRNFQCFKQE